MTNTRNVKKAGVEFFEAIKMRTALRLVFASLGRGEYGLFYRITTNETLHEVQRNESSNATLKPLTISSNCQTLHQAKGQKILITST
jgi:hypothetical protein